LVFVAIWGYLLFGTVPDAGTILGAMVIMSAGLIIWRKEQK
jgi:drug/metabolite transporter (DMT)-like permease